MSKSTYIFLHLKHIFCFLRHEWYIFSYRWENRVYRMLFCEAKKFIKRENKRNDMAGEVSLLLKIKIMTI